MPCNQDYLQGKNLREEGGSFQSVTANVHYLVSRHVGLQSTYKILCSRHIIQDFRVMDQQNIYEVMFSFPYVKKVVSDWQRWQNVRPKVVTWMSAIRGFQITFEDSRRRRERGGHMDRRRRPILQWKVKTMLLVGSNTLPQLGESIPNWGGCEQSNIAGPAYIRGYFRRKLRRRSTEFYPARA